MLTVYQSAATQKVAYTMGLPATKRLEFEVPADLIDRFFQLGGRINDQGQPELDARSYTDNKTFGSHGASVELSCPCATAADAIAELERIAKSRDAQEAARQAEKQAKQKEIDDVARQWLAEWSVDRLVDCLNEQGHLNGIPDGYRYGVDPELNKTMQARRDQATLQYYAGLNVPIELLVNASEINTDYEVYSRGVRGVVRYGNRNLDRDTLYRAVPCLRERVDAIVRDKNNQHKAALREWIVEHFADDPTAVERFDAGVLGLPDIADRLRTGLFARLEDLPRYKRILGKELEHDPDHCYPGREMDFDSNDGVDSCTADEWQRYKAIETAAPEGATVQLREHSAQCGCGASVVRNSCMVTIKKFGFRLSREYALSDD